MKRAVAILGALCAACTTTASTGLDPVDAAPVIAPDAPRPTIDAAPTESDASAPDAAILVATGETCEDARDLRASSSPVDSGTAFAVTGTFGDSDDYNPLMDRGLPPGCSFVYDANGNDVVFAVTLEPGDTLSMQYEVSPNTAPGGLYLLDDCAAGTWPDHDGSGACGSNEYRSQGFCGALGCEPIEMSFTHPRELSGVPTVAHTYWVVADQVTGADATGYALRWSVTPE